MINVSINLTKTEVLVLDIIKNNKGSVLSYIKKELEDKLSRAKESYTSGNLDVNECL